MSKLMPMGIGSPIIMRVGIIEMGSDSDIEESGRRMGRSNA
jgi:hypothetical protein